MNKDAYYFSHDCNARNDVKILKLRRILGTGGYGLFWMLIEVLRESKNYKLPLSSIKELSFDFRESEELILSVVKDFNLFTIDDDYFFFSESLNRRMSSLDSRKKALSEAGRRGRQKQLELPILGQDGATPGPPPGINKINEINIYYLKEELNNVFIDYLDMRKKIKKPATDKAIEIAISTLNKLSNNDDDLKIKIIEQSILNNWQGLFPLKQDKNEVKVEINTSSKTLPDLENYKREGYDR